MNPYFILCIILITLFIFHVFNEPKKKQINLWTLVSKDGRILYTGSEESQIKTYQDKMNYNYETYVIELKGEINV